MHKKIAVGGDFGHRIQIKAHLFAAQQDSIFVTDLLYPSIDLPEQMIRILNE
jgi:hypothetical protein